MRKIIVLFLTSCVTLWAFPYSVETVPNVKLKCQSCYVTNPDGILSASAEHQLNEAIGRLEAETAVEVAVVVVQTIDTDDCYDFAYRLFNHWGLGKSGKDNGLLVLFVADQRAVKIETGYGLEGLLPDMACDNILNEVMFPLFKQGDYDEGFLLGIQAVAEKLTTDEAKEELLLNTNSPKMERVNFWSNYLMIGCCLLILMTWLTYFKMKKLRGERNIRYREIAPFVKRTLLLGVFFWPVLVLVLWLRNAHHKIRYGKYPCSECGKSMRLLSEKEEDAHLSSKAQAEEYVKSVNYDVWLCDNCQNKKILPYTGSAFSYTTCPKCGAKTYKLDSNVVTLPATTLTTGRGVKKYTCHHCNHMETVAYVIPIIVAASSSRSSGGGGFSSGGSWGGGRSGGGGAGGRF